MPHEGYADPIMNDEHESRSDISDRSSSNPATRVIKVTLPTPTISLYDHSFICCHSFIHARIHSSHTSEASHMQLNASQRSVLHHEAAVASFNMSDDQSGFEGRPTKGSRLPRVKQSQRRKHR